MQAHCDVFSISSVMAMEMGTMEMVMVVVDGNGGVDCVGLT